MSAVATPIWPPAVTLDEWVHIPTPGDHYSPRTGSAIITVIREMTRWHAAAGGRSRVLVSRGTWDGYDDGAREEIDFPRLGTPGKWQKAIDCTVGAVLGRRVLSGRTYLAAAYALGRGYDGVVFVHNEPAAVEVLRRRCPNARICLWVQNQLFRTYTPRQTRRVIERSHRVICCSDFIRRGIVAKAGESNRLAVVLNGVDTERFCPDENRVPNPIPVVLFVGRMVPEKGPDILLRAACELKRRGMKFRLRMVGSQNFNAADALTPYERTLRDLARELGDWVEFSPFRPRAEIAQEYQKADILCVPSNWDEPFGLVVIEGMACGLAVVASRRGGIPEIGGSSVCYFPPPDHNALADQIGNLLQYSSESLRLGHLAIQYAHQKSWPQQCRILLGVLNG